MHAVSHSLAHRAPPATRTRVRWQPYSSLPSSMTTLPSPSSTYLNTPSSSAVSSPTLSSSHELIHSRPTSSNSSHHLVRDLSPRDSPKNKFALGLVDQAAKSLCDIWKPQDIPIVFLTGFKATMNSNCPTGELSLTQQLSLQLPYPVSPPAQLSLPMSSASVKSSESPPSNNNLVPVKGFVREVLRRSRTSGHVLQTALCYIEALRPKVPALLCKEKVKESSCRGSGFLDPLGFATDAQFQQHAEVGMSLDTIINTDQCDNNDQRASATRMTTNDSCELFGTLRLAPGQPGRAAGSKLRRLDSLPSMVELPSPLLCPRRSFLAALILASKFTQDKCYSNRAWAKLSGLSPREIGRCERALGEALEWRLWVGKLPVVSQTSSAAPSTNAAARPLHCTRSESCLKPTEPFFVQSGSVPQTDRSLRRCSTLPVEAFTTGGNRANALETTCATIQRSTAQLDESPDSQSSTPPLVYSPTSSDSSSSGDKTVQTEDPNNISLLEVGDQFCSTMATYLPSLTSKTQVSLSSSVFLAASFGQISDGIPSTWRLEVVS